MILKIGFIVVASLGLFLTSCVPIAPQQLASNVADQDAKKFTAPDGKARVYLFHGPYRACGLFGCIDEKLNFLIGFYIDSLSIGTLSKRTGYFVVDVSPGRHVFQWKDIADNPDVTQGDTEINLEANRTYFIRVRKGSGAELMFGALGALAVRPTGQIENVGESGRVEIQEKSLVKPNQDILKQLLTNKPSEKVDQVSSSPPPVGVKDQLVQIKLMFEQGLITKDEYDSKRKQLLEKVN